MPQREIEALFVIKRGFERQQATERKIALINGFLFYNSSGLNSGFRCTWFPFLGISDITFNRGWYIKPHHPDPNLQQYLSRIKRQPRFKELPLRFGTLPAMLISANIGGGFWDTSTGQTLKNTLVKNYPDYFSDIKFKFTPFERERSDTLLRTESFANNSIERFNSWAKENAKVPSIYDFQLPQTIEEIWQGPKPLANEEQPEESVEELFDDSIESTFQPNNTDLSQVFKQAEKELVRLNTFFSEMKKKSEPPIHFSQPIVPPHLANFYQKLTEFLTTHQRSIKFGTSAITILGIGFAFVATKYPLVLGLSLPISGGALIALMFTGALTALGLGYLKMRREHNQTLSLNEQNTDKAYNDPVTLKKQGTDKTLIFTDYKTKPLESNTVAPTQQNSFEATQIMKRLK